MIPLLSIMAGNQDAVEAMGDASLRLIAHELLTSLKGSVTVDRAHGESAQARMRVPVKRIPKRHAPRPISGTLPSRWSSNRRKRCRRSGRGDIMVVDRTVKRRHVKDGRLCLAPENPASPLREVSPETSFEIRGVATCVIHRG